MGKIREPVKKTSIEKKERIIKKGFELMCEKGYHNVTCIDIAKYSGVSTGLIYQYFKDKKDIFLEGVKDYSNKIMFPMLSILQIENLKEQNIELIIPRLIDEFIRNHTISRKAHSELLAMSHLDEEVAKVFNDNEMDMTKKIVSLLSENDIVMKNASEKIHIIIGIVDNYCHEIVYHKHKDLNYDKMKEEVIKVIEDILEWSTK